MPSVYKILGQDAPAINTEVDLYIVPLLTSTVVSSITVANRGTNVATFRVSISQGGGVTVDKDYLYYDVVIGGNDTFIATVGLTLSATDVVRARASGAGGGDLTFQLFGSELT